MKYATLCLLLLTLAACQQPVVEEQPTIHVAALLAQTGPVPECGENSLLGLQLALEERNTEHITLHVEDTQFNPKTSVSAVQKLAAEGVTLFMGPCSSSSTLAVAPVAEELGVLVFTQHSFADAISEAGDFIFRGASTSRVEAPVAMDFVINDLAAKRIGVLYFNNDFGVSYNNQITVLAEENDAEVVLSVAADPPERDFRTPLQKFQEANIDVLYLATTPAQVVPALEQYIEQGMIMPVMVTSLAEDAIVLDAIGGQIEEVYFVSYIPELEKFTERIQEKKPGRLPARDIVQSYVVTNLMLDAIEQCGSNQACVRDTLYTVQNQESLIGEISIDANGDVLYPQMFVKQLTEDGFYRVTG